MNTKIKILTNTLLSIIIVASSICFINEYNEPDTSTNNEGEPKENILITSDKKNNTFNFFSLSNQEYLEKVNYSSNLFSSILEKYNLPTISSKKEDVDYTAYETSLTLERLDIPNGYKQITINPDTNENIKLYLSLINTIQKKEWNQVLNISISANTQPLEFNSSNFPEVFELLENFGKNINVELLSKDINSVLFNNSNNIVNENYSVIKENENNSTFVQISIYSEHGVINED